MVKRISIYIVFLIFSQSLIAQDYKLGDDFVLVVRLVTNSNKADYIEKQLAREDLDEKSRKNYEESLATLITTREQQEAYVVESFRRGFELGHVYFIYDYQLKDWDKIAPLELKGLDGSVVNWNDTFKKPFIMLASGDYTVSHLTEKSLIMLDTDFDRALHPLGMFKSVKVRGKSLFSLTKVEDQWMRSINYFKEHLLKLLSNPESVESLKLNLLFGLAEEVQN